MGEESCCGCVGSARVASVTHDKISARKEVVEDNRIPNLDVVLKLDVSQYTVVLALGHSRNSLAKFLLFAHLEKLMTPGAASITSRSVGCDVCRALDWFAQVRCHRSDSWKSLL